MFASFLTERIAAREFLCQVIEMYKSVINIERM